MSIGAALATACLIAPGTDSQKDPPPPPFGGFLLEIPNLSEPVSVAVSPDDDVLVLESLTSEIHVFSPTGTALRSFGTRGYAPGELLDPRGLALSPDGEIHVSDTGNDRIQVFSKDGAFLLRTFGARGTASGEFNTPLGLAVDKDRVLVADSRNHRIQLFARDGTFVSSIGCFGHADGELCHPSDVAIDPDRNVYVADTDNHRIQVFDASGAFVRAFGGHGPYAGLFLTPSGIRYHRGRLYVADRDNHRVQVYDAKGELLYEWGVHSLRPHEGGGKLHYPDQVAIAPSGRFAAVVESFEDRLQLFGAETEESTIAQRSQEKSTGSHFGPALDSAGATLLLLEPSAPALLVLDVAGDEAVEISRTGSFGPKPGQLVRPEGVAIDPEARRAYVCDPGLGRLSIFDVTRPEETELRYHPNLVRFVKSLDFRALAEEELGQRKPAGGKASDGTAPRDTPAKDPPANASGHPPSSAEAAGPWPIEPEAIVRDAKGKLWLVDAANARVVVLDENLRIVRTIGGPASHAKAADPEGGESGAKASDSEPATASDREPAAPDRGRDAPSSDARLLRPTDLALSPSGEVLYVVDAADCRVKAFDSAGKPLLAFGTRGEGPTDLVRPFGIATSADSCLYVTDEAGHKVVKFDAAGAPLASFGGKGLGKVEFFKPKGVAFDARGRLVVVDWGNHRGQVLTSEGDFVAAFGARLFIQPTLK